jgi:hypothetical protein
MNACFASDPRRPTRGYDDPRGVVHVTVTLCPALTGTEQKLATALSIL